jgi:TPR repeat protein
MKRLVAVFGLSVLLAGASAAPDYTEGYRAYQRGDFEAARRGFLCAAKNGGARAQYHLAFMAYTGLGGARSAKAAVRWALLAADSGMIKAMVLAGSILAEAAGPRFDPVEAHKWFNLAASRAHLSWPESPGGMRHNWEAAAEKMWLIQNRLSENQIREAIRRARAWKAKRRGLEKRAPPGRR